MVKHDAPTRGPYRLEGFHPIAKATAEAKRGNLSKGETLVFQRRRGIKLSGSAHVRSSHSTAASLATANGLVHALADRHASDLSKLKCTRADGTVTSYKTKVKARPGGYTVVAKKKERKKDGLLLHGQSKQVEKVEQKGLASAAREDRKRSIADEGGARFDQVNARGMLRIANFDEALVSWSPWVIHFPKPKKGKAAPSRVMSVTNVAKDGDGRMWVSGDVVPALKKSELVSASISVDDTTQCKKVSPMKVIEIKS